LAEARWFHVQCKDNLLSHFLIQTWTVTVVQPGQCYR
jgi:hypothetical protein